MTNGSIMYMDFSTFLTDFIKNFDMTKYEFIIVSDQLIGSIKGRGQTTQSKFENFDFAENLYPAQSVMAVYYDAGKELFEDEYMEYLGNTDNLADICCIVDLAVKDGKNVVLLCSDTEYKIGYMDTLALYILNNFKLEVMMYEDYKKDESCRYIHNVDEVLEYLKFQMSTLQNSSDFVLMYNRFSEDMAQAYRKILESKSIDCLKELAEQKGIHISPRMRDKEQIVDVIYKRLINPSEY